VVVVVVVVVVSLTHTEEEEEEREFARPQGRGITTGVSGGMRVLVVLTVVIGPPSLPPSPSEAESDASSPFITDPLLTGDTPPFFTPPPPPPPPPPPAAAVRVLGIPTFKG